MSYLNQRVREEKSKKTPYCSICGLGKSEGDEEVGPSHRHTNVSHSNLEQQAIASMQSEYDPVGDAMAKVLRETAGRPVYNEPPPRNPSMVQTADPSDAQIYDYMGCHRILREQGAEAAREKFPQHIDRCEREVAEEAAEIQAKYKHAREKPFNDKEWHKYEVNHK